MKPQQKYDRMMKRQGSFTWGDPYVACILAKTGEAPGGSWYSRLNSGKLQRAIHALSLGERFFAQLALYHPDLLELHEQKMLSPGPTVHPLYGHPMTVGLDLPPVAGTLAVAQKIGLDHFQTYLERDDYTGWVPFPYVGDLLLYFLDDARALRVVNWTVKNSREDFDEQRRGSFKSFAKQKKDREKANLRRLLESEYYLSAGIPTVEVAYDDVDKVLKANFNLIFNKHNLVSDVGPHVLEAFSCEVKNAVLAGKNVNDVAFEYAMRHGHRDQFIARIYQDIWERRLLIDLFTPIEIHRPLKLQRVDVIDHFEHLFKPGVTC